jgi:site-specific DNA-methyltransferase (adenine-specific)
MKLYSNNESYKLYEGNMLDMLEVIEPKSIDSIVCDPPYELNFMNKGWDNSGIAFQKETWEKCYEVLKEGGYLLAFGGSRTYHRIAVAIEDAGFEIRDTIMWIYGSGFPKSMALDKAIEGKLTTGSANKQIFRKLNGEMLDRGNYGYASVAERQGARPADYNEIDEQRLGKLEPTTELSKKYQGWGTQLKPSFEPIIVARKPFKGSLVDNVIKNGVGGINIDECRAPFEDTPNPATNPKYRKNAGYKLPEKGQISNGAVAFTSSKNETNDLGRFPANTILTYDETDFDEVCGGFPNTKGGTRHNTVTRLEDSTSYGGKAGSVNIRNEFNDSGSASRYFYCAKASKKDRDEGLEEIEEKPYAVSNQAIAELKRGNLENTENRSQMNSVQMRKNTHPTVKPTDLMQYLVRLVTPNGGTILDPFNGSGSTGKAVMYENKERNKNYKYIGIELTEEYLPIAKARIEYVCKLIENEKDLQMTIDDYL